MAEKRFCLQCDDGTELVHECYVFRYLSRSAPLYPTVIRRDLENGFL